MATQSLTTDPTQPHDETQSSLASQKTPQSPEDQIPTSKDGSHSPTQTPIKTEPKLSLESSYGLNKVIMLRSEIELCIDEITDLIDEHSIVHASIEHTNRLLKELSQYRKELRSCKKTLLNIAPDEHSILEPSISRTLDLINDFNVNAYDHINKSNVKSEPALHPDSFGNQLEAMLFNANDIVDHITELKTALDVKIDEYDDQQLLQARSELTNYDKKLHTIADRYERLLKFPVSNETLSKLIKDIGIRYASVKKKKSTFASEIQSAITSREVIKFKSFDEAKLGIDLKKFAGYDSIIDIYTFKSDFEKVNLTQHT